MIIICPACAHQAHLKRIKGIVSHGLVCSICRSHAYLRYLRFRGWMHDLKERERQLAELSTLAGLLWIAEQRGYKRGWAACKWRVIFHDWPRLEAVPEQPCYALREWVKKQNQAYAREQGKIAAHKSPQKIAGDLSATAQKHDEKHDENTTNAHISDLMSEADWQVDL